MQLRPIPCWYIYEIVYFFNTLTMEPDMRRDELSFSYQEDEARKGLAELEALDPSKSYMVDEGVIYE